MTTNIILSAGVQCRSVVQECSAGVQVSYTGRHILGVSQLFNSIRDSLQFAELELLFSNVH